MNERAEIDVAGSGVSKVYLARARTAYRGALDSARAWRGFSTNPKHHDATYWSLLTSLFADPGMNRSTLIDRIIEYGGASRSTAERAIRDARDCGLIVDRPSGNQVLYSLSDKMVEHCISFFANYMDRDQIMKNLGYDNEK